MQYKVLVIMLLCSMALCGCSVSSKSSVEPTTYAPVEHNDTPIKLMDNTVLDYQAVDRIVESCPEYCFLLQNDDSNDYTVFNVKPVGCENIESYVTDESLELSESNATSCNYFAKIVGQSNIPTIKFNCSLLYDSDGAITGAKLDRINTKGDDS